jgi:NosR/NirI family nitrous oxide reductase transcriptional regulator
MNFIRTYLGWLQKNNPTGTVDRFPELSNRFETSVPGIYCIGDLTGIPLIKPAAESGFELVERLNTDETFQRRRSPERLDLVIVGAGPAGVSAALRVQQLGFTYTIIEASRPFNTIMNYPVGKPIHVTPEEPPMRSALQFSDGAKETLIGQLQSKTNSLDIHCGETVTHITADAHGFRVTSDRAEYPCLRVVVAIGKSGNTRRLNVPGDSLPKVFTRLIDPLHHQNQDILVVGGGDSAVEAAIALARAGNRVTLTYRKPELSRPKGKNIAAFQGLVATGAITPMLSSTVERIEPSTVTIRTTNGSQTIPNSVVYSLIGTEIPIKFFQRSKLRLEGERRAVDWLKIAALLLFAGIVYFGKKAPAAHATDINSFFMIPAGLFNQPWPAMINGLAAWGCFIGIIAAGSALAFHVATHPRQYVGTRWKAFKHGYFTAIFIVFASVYVNHGLFGYDPGFWYTALYSLTIVVFGLRRMHVHPTGYIRRQTITLILIQVIPLFILPVFVFPYLGKHGYLGAWILREVFPDGSYWRAYGLILAWPLFIHNLAMGGPTLFWLITALVQTFVIIPFIVYRWGKGAYCGWICSCGALAETLGDEYRTAAPHGPAAKAAENSGQAVLLFAVVVTIFTSLLGSAYNLAVDTILAGVLGVGVYFSLSGRVWCRFFCPLAALMHIYARFSIYRIIPDKSRCISCNICTKVCHMGIDVMSYAARGIPMDDVECVRCSACIVNCPMQVLTFGRVSKAGPAVAVTPPGWQNGLPDASRHG